MSCAGSEITHRKYWLELAKCCRITHSSINNHFFLYLHSIAFLMLCVQSKSVKDCFWCNFSEVFFPHCNDILDSCRDLVYIWICVVMCHLGVTLQLQFLSTLYLLLFCSQSKLFPGWSDKVGIYDFSEITRIVISLKLATKLSKLSCNLI